MQKINFKNLPSTDTPLNAENLNLLQQNIENEFTGTNIFKFKGALDYTTNFNSQNITGTGYYDYNGYIGDDTGKYRPTNTKCLGILLVFYAKSYNMLTQVFYGSAGEIYYRFFQDGSWAPWMVIEAKDSGWINLPLEAGISVGSIVGKAQYRKVGKIVYIRGDVRGISGAGTTFAKLPSGYRPSSQHYFLSEASGKRYSRNYISTNGDLVLEWVSDDNYDLAWFAIDTSFLVD